MTTINLSPAQSPLWMDIAQEVRRGPAPRVAGDDLFPDGLTITCVVCARVATVPVTHPARLCPACMADLDTTGREAAEVYAAAIVRWQRAYEALETVGQDNTWWAQVWAYRHSDAYDPAAFARAWQAAKDAGGEKARLCGLWEALDALSPEMETQNARYRDVMAELRAARDAAGWPLEV